jgi:hypothetical protein
LSEVNDEESCCRKKIKKLMDDPESPIKNNLKFEPEKIKSIGTLFNEFDPMH